jgi:hypothetical protein
MFGVEGRAGTGGSVGVGGRPASGAQTRNVMLGRFLCAATASCARKLAEWRRDGAVIGQRLLREATACGSRGIPPGLLVPIPAA